MGGVRAVFVGSIGVDGLFPLLTEGAGFKRGEEDGDGGRGLDW